MTIEFQARLEHRDLYPITYYVKVILNYPPPSYMSWSIFQIDI